MPTATNLAYEGSAGTVSLDGPLLYVGTALGIRGRKWTYTLGRRNISSQVRQATEASLSAKFLSLQAADDARTVFDTDVAAGTPGKLVSGEWSQRAYVVASSPSTRYHEYVSTSLTVLLLDGSWSRTETTHFYPSQNVSDYGKQYTYGYPYDYAPYSSARTAVIPGTEPNPFRLVIYGRAVSPSITIAGNLYQFDISVPSGGYLLVDTSDDPVVQLVTADGIVSDAFDSANRGSGEGSGEYAFQPIPPGMQLVSWDDSFGFDLTIYHQESELPWTSSS